MDKVIGVDVTAEAISLLFVSITEDDQLTYMDHFAVLELLGCEGETVTNKVLSYIVGGQERFLPNGWCQSRVTAYVFVARVKIDWLACVRIGPATTATR